MRFSRRAPAGLGLRRLQWRLEDDRPSGVGASESERAPRESIRGPWETYSDTSSLLGFSDAAL